MNEHLKFTEITPPQTQQELLLRCEQLAGNTLGEVAQRLGWTVPDNLLKDKGWVGQLLEAVLGADAGNQAEPDFLKLDIELKSLPINAAGQPKESTYVCTVDLRQDGRLQWENAWVKRKLSKVLWVPVEADPDTPLAERYIGQAWLWQPSQEQEQILQQDWEELMDRVVVGEHADVTAKQGQYLQIRPKAANSRVLATTWDDEGSITQSNPRGFYLRTSFTGQLYRDAIQQSYAKKDS